ncbi:MAG: sigma-70 family RNA polymerase sigma factor [Candidatus Hydrogenedentes bacterium]|nr:sigma-70 family RNA polymerase sigma factor [Candidatus Hydrogenedentota bacterium]
MHRKPFNPTKRYLAFMNPEAFKEMPAERGLWHEAAAEVRAGLRWGRRKAELLEWVRRHMALLLTTRERECIELHYFQGRTYMVIAALTGTSASSSCRAVLRGIRKLRQAAIEQGLVRTPDA